MNNKKKDIFYGLGGIIFIFLMFGAFVLLIMGGARLFEIIYPVLEKISSFVWAIVWLLLFLSIIPRLRNFTGNGIILGTYIGGAIFWLLSFYVTYSLWGFLGIIVGVLFFGLGVFATAVLALLFDGQISTAFYFIFILVQIYFFRMLGYWITKQIKYEKTVGSVDEQGVEENTIKSLDDELYNLAKEEVIKSGEASTVFLQNRFNIGYRQALGLIKRLEEDKIISSTEEKSEDELYDLAKEIIIKSGRVSAYLLQYRLKIGYAKAMHLISMLEEEGVIKSKKGSGWIVSKKM